MSEQVGVVLIFAGLLLLLAGLFSLVGRGISTLLGRGSPRRLLRPLALLAGGLLLGAAPFVWQEIHMAIVGFGPRETVVDGRVAVNLTGWDRDDYGLLAERPEIGILEMANPDVTDATLEPLEAMPGLIELTLNDSGLTDAGLVRLARLEALEVLRIARTQITAQGLIAFLESPPPRLRSLDVSGNAIPTSILRRWKNAAPQGQQRRYVN